MKKPLFSLSLLLLLAGAAPQAHAQLGALVRTGMNLHTLASRPSAAEREALKDSLNGLSTGAYSGKRLRMQRTPADKLPKKGAEQITTLENELARCHAALLAGPTATISTPEQQAVLQQALIAVARTGQTQHLPVYQEEAAFYAAENTRRQAAAK